MLVALQEGAGRSEAVFDASLNCFFNALLRETRHWQFAGEEGRGFFLFALPGGHSLRVPCEHFSRTGRHGLRGPCQLARADGGVRSLTFAEAAALALKSLDVDAAEAERVLERVLQSARNIADTLQARAAELDALFTAPLDFIEAESGLLIGHSVHPCPKARDRFADRDARAYAPEYRGGFPLLWVAVRRGHQMQFAGDGFLHSTLLAELAQCDACLRQWLAAYDDAEWVLLPCHPFQWPHWRAIPALAQRIAAGEMRLLGAGGLRWRATSSLRAVYSEQSPWMLKFSLSVKLTNSLRHLQPEELIRGAQLATVMASAPGRALQSRFPQMRVLPEPVALSLLDDDGVPLPAASLVWRANPFTGAGAAGTEVLATLLQDDPRDGIPRLVKRMRATGCGGREAMRDWFRRYLDVAVRPLLAAQADYGILFGAHQQNIVLALENGIWPATLYFRDCQGTGFSALARRQLAEVFPGLAAGGALVIDREMTTTLFIYYLFLNATFNVISSLAMSGSVAESELLEQLRAFLWNVLEEGVGDDSVIQTLLHAPQLKIKGNFHCALSDLNENTHTDVLDLYRPIENPLAVTGN